MMNACISKMHLNIFSALYDSEDGTKVNEMKGNDDADDGEKYETQML